MDSDIIIVYCFKQVVLLVNYYTRPSRAGFKRRVDDVMLPYSIN